MRPFRREPASDATSSGLGRRSKAPAIEWEFGGPVGVLGVMVGSHLLVYYLWISVTFYKGSIARPTSWSDLLPFLGRMWSHVIGGALPNAPAVLLYGGFLTVELFFAWVLPGPRVLGLPIDEEGGRKRVYHCNGAASWYATLALVALLHFTGLVPITEYAKNLGPMLTTAVLIADTVAVSAYVTAVRAGMQVRMTGSVVYDFFMGAVLNPTIGRIELKFFTVARISFFLLFVLTCSAAVQYYDLYGHVSWPLLFMVAAHGLYANACAKGEECIPSSWDIFHEKWGWMLIFWNLAGVPWVYSFNSYFLLVNPSVTHSVGFLGFLFVALLAAYFVWDTSQSQKNRFRMQERGTGIRRRTFPQLPWGTLQNPRYLVTESGHTLLIDGWWRYARKIHYTADLAMAVLWGLACGFSGALPYFYPAFFTLMIIHRGRRDEKRCSTKYGDSWEQYKRVVPKKFIPYIL
ncbi:MAG: delta(((1)))-sterol reductase [Frankiales bacterium]|nr:delta(((1)))-sterol reductase [Frankiales bacterium]